MNLAVPNERLRTLPVVSSFIDYFPGLLRLKPLYLAQEILEQPASFSADTLFELVESVPTVRGLSNSLGSPSSTR
jgi:hypothetical protein